MIDGSTSIRLAKRLEKEFRALGRDVKVDFFTVAKGWWRSSPFADCYRWEAFATERFAIHSSQITIGSYDTMTAILKHKGRAQFSEPLRGSAGHLEADIDQTGDMQWLSHTAPSSR